MKKIYLIVLFFSLLGSRIIYSQALQDTTIYLITCAPGVATYSIYGHSAIRVQIQHENSDIVYNWGVFDFNTPNFVWKFAKGRLNYLCDSSEFQLFMPEYFYEKRSVYSQRINFDSHDKKIFLNLVRENRLPQNRYYRYDFFYDDCSTRIRDLIEKTVGTKLIYPPDEKNQIRSFREMVGEYQSAYPWLKMGVDLIMGTPGEVKAGFRERMFLPYHLQKNLSKALIASDQKRIPLLSSPETLVSFELLKPGGRFYTTPFFIFSLFFIVIVIITAIYKNGRLVNILDIFLFFLFSVLSVLMVFFSFFTDHEQMKWNLNIIWFNPLIILCLIYLITRKPGIIIFRVVFYLSVIMLPLILFFPNAFNNSFLPVILILSLRSSVRGKFKWNPIYAE
jgi:hypothetical protein